MTECKHIPTGMANEIKCFNCGKILEYKWITKEEPKPKITRWLWVEYRPYMGTDDFSWRIDGQYMSDDEFNEKVLKWYKEKNKECKYIKLEWSEQEFDD